MQDTKSSAKKSVFPLKHEQEVKTWMGSSTGIANMKSSTKKLWNRTRTLEPVGTEKGKENNNENQRYNSRK